MLTRTLVLAAHDVRVFSINPPSSKTEGAGKAGCPSHPWSACRKKARGRTTGTSRTTGLPCAMVLRLIRALPGDQALLSPLPCVISQGVAPALGRQDHTTSPSASCCSSGNTSRPSHPAAYVRDDREAPLMWQRDGRSIVLICPTAQRESPATDCHDGQFAHGCDARDSLSPSFRGTRSVSPESRDSGLSPVGLPRNDRGEIPGAALTYRPGMTVENRIAPE